MMRKKRNAAQFLAAWAAVCMGMSVYAADTDGLESYRLDGVTVEGTQDTLPGGFLQAEGSVGLLGQMDVMATPFSITTVNNETIRQFSSPYNGVTDALAFSPSVRTDRGGTYTDVSIRGLYQSGHSMYVNGIPNLLCQERIPYFWVDSVSVISGPNIGVAGTSLSEGAAGVVNFTSKKAGEEPNASVSVGYRGGSSAEESIDVGGRFGKDGRYGIRVTASNIHGETSIDGETLEQQGMYVNLDQQTSHSKTNLLIGYDHTNHEGGPGAISFGSDVTALPGAPDASRIYKPDWTYNEYDNWIVALNHEQKLSDHVTAFVNAGYHREDWYGYIDGNPMVIDNAGNFTLSITNYPLALTKEYIGLGVKGDFMIGSVRNEYVIGVDKNWQNYDLSANPNFGNDGKWTGSGNLYEDNSWANPGKMTWNPAHSQDVRMTGWHIVDTMKALDDALQVMVGVHGHEVDKTPANGENQKSDAVSPTFAVSYKFNPDTMVYASHTESSGIGSMVSTSNGYANAGEILDPSKTKQNEIGVKVRSGKFVNTLSLFQIKQANTIDVYENGQKYLRLDGEQDNKGVEWSITGEIGKKWDLIGGVMYLDAKDNQGRDVNGASEWSGVLGAIYRPSSEWSLLGRMMYVGNTTINNGVLDVPSYVKFDLGASYKTKIGETPLTVNAMLYNINGKDYWAARAGSSSLSVGAPRTFVLSATVDL